MTKMLPNHAASRRARTVRLQLAAGALVGDLAVHLRDTDYLCFR